MSSSAGPEAAKEDTSKGTKRSPEEQSEGKAASGAEISPPAPKTAKPNPPPADEDKTEKATAAGAAAAAVGAVVAGKPQNAGPTDSERVEAEALSSLGLGVGTRLEVMWLLEEDEKSVEKVGVLCKVVFKKSCCGRPCYF